MAGNTNGDTCNAPESVRNLDLFVLLLVLLAWVPVPVGSNRGWSVAILQATALTIVGVWSLRYTRKPFAIPVVVRELHVPLSILLLWLCVPLVQIVPLPTWLVQVVSGGSDSPYSIMLVLPHSDFQYLSVDRSATLSGFLRQCALVAVFFSVLSLVTTRSRLRAVLVLLFLVGFVQALYGLTLYLGGDGIGLWNPGHEPGTVSGTYINQNHFAGLMEMSIPAGMGLLLMDWKPHESGYALKSSFRVILSLTFGRRGLVLFALLVMFAAMILSTSRGAMGSLAAAISVVALTSAIKKRTVTRELKLGLVAIALVAIAMIWLGPGQLTSKLASSGMSSNRGDLRELSYAVIADNPIIGSGVGTYRWVLPKYKDERFGSGFYEHAHNDYLEMLGEQGILGFSLLFLSAGLIVAGILKANSRKKDSFVRGVLFASLVGCMSLLMHGLVDFNLHIPANAAWFFALLGIGAVAARMGTEEKP